MYNTTVKVYASWCRTCKQFDVARYRKIVSQFGDKYDENNNSSNEMKQKGRVRFAEMQYDNPQNEEVCQVLNATIFPYILMYYGSKGKVREFQCTPAKYKMLVDAVNEELADDDSGDSEIEQQVIDLGLAGRR